MKMSIKGTLGCLAVLLLLLQTGSAVAQEEKKWQERGYYRPKAILVQLRSEKRRIAYLEQKHRMKDAEEIRKDLGAVNTAMINDFRDNFNFCPVYFFVDTNIAKVKAEQFYGILFDRDMHAIGKSVTNDIGNKYFVVYYGHPESETTESASRTHFGEGLVVTDNTYRQMQKPFPFYYYSNTGYYHIARKNEKYGYSSGKFNIEYYALAGDLNAGLRDFYAH